MDELTGMGYSKKWRENVLTSAIEGYMKIAHKENRNRSGSATLMSRRHKRLCGKSTWFQGKTNNEPRDETKKTEEKPKPKKGAAQKGKVVIESVWFIPYTKNSALKERLTKVEERLNFPQRMKYVEKLGSKVVELLATKNP